MCGRFALSHEADTLSKQLDLALPDDYVPRYNIAPAQNVLCVIGQNNQRSTAMLKWSFIPHWSKKIPERQPINARFETVREKPFFRSAFKRHRCVIPASGFYEWEGKSKPKQPYYIYPAKSDEIFFFAGIWSSVEPSLAKADQSVMLTCAIITMEAEGTMQELHSRTPAVIPRENMTAWLNTENEAAAELIEKPVIEYHPVSSYVNNPRNQGESCIEQVSSV